jgi:hypothetical protein
MQCGRKPPHRIRETRTNTHESRTNTKPRSGLDAANTPRRNHSMNLAIWLPAMFVLGIAMMGLCLLFLEACDKI